MTAPETPPVPPGVVAREPVLVIMSVLAGLQVIAAAANLAELIGRDQAALFALIVAGVQVGVQFYVRGKVTPAG